MAIPPASRMALVKTGIQLPISRRWSSVPVFQAKSWLLVSQAVDSEAALMASAWRVQAKPARIGAIDRAHAPAHERRPSLASSRVTANSANGATQNSAVVILTIVARQPRTRARTNHAPDPPSRQRRPLSANANDAASAEYSMSDARPHEIPSGENRKIASATVAPSQPACRRTSIQSRAAASRNEARPVDRSAVSSGTPTSMTTAATAW